MNIKIKFKALGAISVDSATRVRSDVFFGLQRSASPLGLRARAPQLNHKSIP